MGEIDIGATVAGYRIDGLIARGGMGVVYRATHLALERPVALKVIAANLSQDPGFRRRFLRESQLAASLDHPNIVPVFDAREERGELIVAMRLVEGGDLKQRLSAGPMSAEKATDLLAGVADALDVAHDSGIVHRDIKPQNILVESDRAYLTDFGLAKALDESGAGSTASVVGTLGYMSPEQWRGTGIGPPADVYSLGCVFYEAVTGVVPFARLEGDSEPEMPAGLDEVIERAVSKDPEDRYPTAGALIAAARERQGAAPQKTRVLWDREDGPTVALSQEPSGLALSRWRKVFAGGFALAFVLAALAMIVAFVVGAFLLRGGDDIAVSDPVAIGRPPLRLAVDLTNVWAVSVPDRTLTAVDPSTLERQGEPIRFREPVAAVATGLDAVWVSSPAGHVVKVEPVGRAISRIDVGGRPGAIAYGARKVWVADTAGGGVTVIDAASGRVEKRGIPPRAAPLRLAHGAGAVWVSSASTGSVRRIALATLRAAPPILAGRGPAGITVGGGLVWVANSRSGTVTRIDPTTQRIVGDPLEVGTHPGGIDAGTDSVWVADSMGGTVTRLRIADGTRDGDPVEVGPVPGAVVVGSTAVWVGLNGSGSLIRLEP